MDPSAGDSVVLALTEDETVTREVKRRRQLAMLSHFAARTMALLTYLFCSWFTYGFIAPVVVILTFLAADLWLVKHVSGRLLVGLRWWNEVDPSTGKSKWLFESGKAPATGLGAARAFWAGLLVFPVIWILLTVVAILSLRFIWALVAVCAVLSTGVNVYGYLRCRFRSNAGGDDAADDSSMLSLLKGSVAKSVITELWTGSAKPQQSSMPPQMPV